MSDAEDVQSHAQVNLIKMCLLCGLTLEATGEDGVWLHNCLQIKEEVSSLFHFSSEVQQENK